MEILKAIFYQWLFITIAAALFLGGRVLLAALFRVPGWVEGAPWENYRSLAFEYRTAVYRPGYGPPVKQVDRQSVLFPFLPDRTPWKPEISFWKPLVVLCLISGLNGAFPAVGLAFWSAIYLWGFLICWRKASSQWKTLQNHPQLDPRLKALAHFEILWTGLWALLICLALCWLVFKRLPDIL